MKNPITIRQKELLTIIYQYIKDTGYPPTFEEMRGKLGVSSNQSVLDLLFKLEKRGLIKRNEAAARGLTILPLGYEIINQPSLAPFLGVTSAGTGLEAIALPGLWQKISSDVAKLADKVFLLKISGDSMINAGINDGDMVLVKQHKEFVSGDIVYARIGSDSTVKRFISDDSPPYVYLKPENPKYKIIPFTDETELEGKIISVFKQEQWKPI